MREHRVHTRDMGATLRVTPLSCASLVARPIARVGGHSVYLDSQVQMRALATFRVEVAQQWVKELQRKYDLPYDLAVHAVHDTAFGEYDVTHVEATFGMPSNMAAVSEPRMVTSQDITSMRERMAFGGRSRLESIEYLARSGSERARRLREQYREGR
jgi:hypothetical protein